MLAPDEWAHCEPEALAALAGGFAGLAPAERQRVIMSLLHLRKRAMEEKGDAIQQLLAAAQRDEDEWVALLATLLRDIRATGRLATDCEPMARIAAQFGGLLSEAATTRETDAFEWEAGLGLSLEPGDGDSDAQHFRLRGGKAGDLAEAWDVASSAPAGRAAAAAAPKISSSGGGSSSSR